MVKLPGTNTTAPVDAHSIGPVPSDERVEITVRVRRRAALPTPSTTQDLSQRQYLTREQYEAAHGASDADMNAVSDFARQFGMVEVGRSAAQRLPLRHGVTGGGSIPYRARTRRAPGRHIAPLLRPDVRAGRSRSNCGGRVRNR